MRVFLLGGAGQIGWELQHCLAPATQLEAPPRSELDALDSAALRGAVRTARPDVIINAAALTDVERAEAEPELAHGLNALVPRVLAEEALRCGASLVHYSTDYVFDGTAKRPYREQDLTHPLNVYGRTKLAGEEAVRQVCASALILRTSWVYSLRRRSFVTSVLGWARRQDVLHVVSDQVSSPTWSRTVAEATAAVLAAAGTAGPDWLRSQAGLYHIACTGTASRYEWAQAILRLAARKDPMLAREVLPAASGDFASAVVRPAFSALDSSHFAQHFGIILPAWQDALQVALAGPA